MADDDQDLTTEGEEIQEPTRPEWLPPNFQSPEDLAKSYRSAEQKITEMGQRNAEMERQLQEFQTYQEALQSQQQQGQQLDYAQQLAQRWEEGDGMTQMEIASLLIREGIQDALKNYQPPQTPDGRLNEMVALTAEQQMEQRHADYGDYKDQMRAVVEQDPWLQSKLSSGTAREIAETLESVYNVTKAKAIVEGKASVAESLAETNRLIKNQAQTLSGQSIRQEQETYWDKIKASDGSLPSFRDVK